MIFINDSKATSFAASKFALEGNENIFWIVGGLPKKFDVYFVHSFCLLSTSSNNILSTTTYEGINFCSAVKKDNIIGLQFHPEKSGERGLKLLSNVFKK